MANKNYEFRPDKSGSGLLSRLYLTRLQRQAALKWLLYSVVILILSVLQDVVLCELYVWGGTTDLVPCAILMVCVLEGADSGSLFCLIAALVYLFSGSSPGYHVLFLLPVLGVGATIFRESLLRKSFSATVLCTGGALILYELVIFGMALFLNLTHPGRLSVALITWGLSFAVTPLLYPIWVSIGKIGGQTWKE